MAEAERFYGGRRDIIDLYMNVSDLKAVRDAAMEARKKLNSFSTEMLYVILSLHALLLHTVRCVLLSILQSGNH